MDKIALCKLGHLEDGEPGRTGQADGRGRAAFTAKRCQWLLVKSGVRLVANDLFADGKRTRIEVLGRLSAITGDPIVGSTGELMVAEEGLEPRHADYDSAALTG